MCSAIYPWQELCAESNYNITLEIVPYPTDHDSNWTDSIMKQMDDDVLVVCLPPLHWSDGALIDLEVVGNACKHHHSVFIVDATQAVGIMPCSVKKWRPSILACSVHKVGPRFKCLEIDVPPISIRFYHLPYSTSLSSSGLGAHQECLWFTYPRFSTIYGHHLIFTGDLVIFKLEKHGKLVDMR
jgi:hypothetical protein